MKYDSCAEQPNRRETFHRGELMNCVHVRRSTLRFYALRLHEMGMIKSTPRKIITQGTDWRFLNELKKELKG